MKDHSAAAVTAIDGNNSSVIGDVVCFIRTLTLDAIPPDVIEQALRCLLDLIGVAAGGSRMPAVGIINDHAIWQMASRDHGARLLFDGRRAGIAGAAFAGAATIDALDAHDGHVLTKGHAGVAVLPALLATIDSGVACDGAEFITCLVLGYELGTRAGIALHRSVPDYHCSGAWNALACAAICGRLLKLDDATMREALGIAEYAGPRGQILRVCASPSMLKDGSSFGAHVGVTATLLARSGMTGAPAVTITDARVRDVWNDVGTRWRIREQYFKAYPVCRWAQPAIEAALALKRQHGFDATDIHRIRIESFREAIDLGSQCPAPVTTDDAQYSLPYGVAAALVFDRVGAAEVNAEAIADPRVAQMLAAIELAEDAEFSARFPAERWARVHVTLADGRSIASEPARARGNPENPLSDDELVDKYRALATPVLGPLRTARIEALVKSLTTDERALTSLRDAVLESPDSRR